MKKSVKIKALLSLILLAVSGINMILFKQFPSFFFPVYRKISQKWIAMLGDVCSVVKVAVWDILMILLAVLLIVYTVRTIIKKRSFFQWLTTVILAVCILVFSAVNGWMLNHYAPKMSEYIGLDVEEYSVGQLYDACEYYLLKAAEYAPLIERDGNKTALDPDFYETSEKAGSSYEELAEKYPVFAGSNKPVKKLSVVGEYLMYNGIVGMFMPLSGEAGVPGSVPAIPLGYTMCHEAAHRLGIASEQEANYAAFMACINSNDAYFIYSGYYNAFSYTFSSLWKADSEKALELYEKYPDNEGVLLLQKDRQDTREYYRKYESPLQDISDQINDRYLKTFSQESGIQSYGEVTDYLIAFYLTEQ